MSRAITTDDQYTRTTFAPAERPYLEPGYDYSNPLFDPYTFTLERPYND